MTSLRIAALAIPSLFASLLSVHPLPAQTTSSSLPPISPTALPAPIAATSSPATTSLQPHRATVTYAAGLLNVRADNSSLNQILRQVARLTGMTITGGVADERVFGDYGPAEPSTVLATLLDGTGSNMLLTEGPEHTITSLTLTPRSGGVTPPSPTSNTYASPDDDRDDREPLRQDPHNGPHDLMSGRDSLRPQSQPQILQQSPQANQPVANPAMVQPLNNVNGSPANTSPTASEYPTTNSVPTSSLPAPSTTPSSNGIVDAPNPPPPGTTTSTSAPAGPPTPESIYQQLKALQAAQQPQPQATPSTATPAPQ